MNFSGNQLAMSGASFLHSHCFLCSYSLGNIYCRIKSIKINRARLKGTIQFLYHLNVTIRKLLPLRKQLYSLLQVILCFEIHSWNSPPGICFSCNGAAFCPIKKGSMYPAMFESNAVCYISINCCALILLTNEYRPFTQKFLSNLIFFYLSCKIFNIFGSWIRTSAYSSLTQHLIMFLLKSMVNWQMHD